MKTTLTLKNYRCFLAPATVELARGFSAFVGVNNAGKSAFMRFLLEFRPLLSMLTDRHLFHTSINQPISFPHQFLHVFDQVEVFSNLNEESILFELLFASDTSDEVGFKILKVSITLYRHRLIASNVEVDGRRFLASDPSGTLDANGNLYVQGRVIVGMSHFFETMSYLAQTQYVGPFRNTVNVGSNDAYLDIQIGQAFIKQFRGLKTGNDKKANTGISELTEKIRNIFQFQSLDISPSHDDQSLHLTVNNRPYKQHEVGTGLLQFVIVLANVAIKKPKLLLIDEPELSLHPALQLSFLTALGAYAQDIWFSTHSIGLARAGAERVYSVTRRADGDSIVRPFLGTPRLGELLGELGYSAHKELGFEKLLLVEGPTELKTLQELLRKTGKDHRVLLLPLHGHMPKPEELEELLRITTDIAVLIDSERLAQGQALNKDRSDFMQLCNSKNILSHALDRRAMENYFSDTAVKQVFGSQYRALAPFEKLANVNPHWSKSLNWKLAAAMPFSEFAATDLGQFINSL